MCLLLVGQPELEQKLAARAFRPLRQRISVRYRLQPFGYRETRDYIYHRIQKVQKADCLRFQARSPMAHLLAIWRSTQAHQSTLRSCTAWRICKKETRLLVISWSGKPPRNFSSEKAKK